MDFPLLWHFTHSLYKIYIFNVIVCDVFFLIFCHFFPLRNLLRNLWQEMDQQLMKSHLQSFLKRKSLSVLKKILILKRFLNRFVVIAPVLNVCMYSRNTRKQSLVQRLCQHQNRKCLHQIKILTQIQVCYYSLPLFCVIRVPFSLLFTNFCNENWFLKNKFKSWFWPYIFTISSFKLWTKFS